MKSPEKYGTCKILTNHFSSGLCKKCRYEVQILEKIEGTGRTERGTIDVKVSNHRKQQENYWIKTLRTVFPYGLNNRLADQISERIGSKFYPLRRVFIRVSRKFLLESVEV